MKINLALCTKRKQKDIVRLQMKDYQVTLNKTDQSKLSVLLKGPPGSLYENG